MNVTLKLPDSLCKSARHRAVDDGLSLSAWVAKMIEKEVGSLHKNQPDNLLDWIGDDRLAEQDFEPVLSKDAPIKVSW